MKMKNTLVEDNGKTTWFLDGRKTVIVKVYDGCKYDPESKKIAEVEYEISGFGLYNGSDFSNEAYKEMEDEDMIDEYDEYLKLWFGHRIDSATFRNSHVDMFMK